MRILVVEDELAIAQNMPIPENCRPAPETVHDGEEAWFKGSTEQYGAIVLDLGLPSSMA